MTEHDDALKELGRMLTERREKAGMTLETVFDRTKIRPEYLKGIESGDYKDFPEVVYIKGFVRTYLKLINAEDMQDDFMAQLDRMQPGSSGSRKHESSRQHKNMSSILGNGSSFPKGFKPASHFWLFLVLVLALAGTGAYVWYAVSYGGLDLKTLKLFNFTGAGGSAAVSGISGDIDALIDGEAVPVSLDVSGDEEPDDEEEANPSLEIHAVNDVWLSVAFGNAAPSYRRTLRRGEVMRWDLTAPARVVIGRPSAAQVILNGQDLGIVNPSARKSETYIYSPDGTFRRANAR